MSEILYRALPWLIPVNLIAFVLMGVDKHRARRRQWRIPERTLLLFAVLGGTPGAILGMELFHHKIRHRKFCYGLPAILVVQLAVLALLCRE